MDASGGSGPAQAPSGSEEEVPRENEAPADAPPERGVKSRTQTAEQLAATAEQEKTDAAAAPDPDAVADEELSKLHADSIVAAKELQTAGMIPAHIEVTAEAIAALKVEDIGIESTEDLIGFFKTTPSVDKVKEDHSDVKPEEMNLREWVVFLQGLQVVAEEVEEAGESGFIGGIGALFGKFGDWLKGMFVKLKLMFAGWGGGESDEEQAKEADASEEAEALQISMQPTIKDLVEEGKLSESMKLTPMGVRSLNKLGIDSPGELASFFEDKRTVVEVGEKSPQYNARLEDITMDSYIRLLNTLPDEEDVQDEGPLDSGDTAAPQDSDAIDDTDAPVDTGSGSDNADAPQTEAPSGSALDNYFWDYPRGNNEITRKDAVPFETKDGGPNVQISKNRIAVGDNEFKMSLRLTEDVPATPVSILNIKQTKTGFIFKIKAIALGEHEVPLTFDETKALIKGLQDNQAEKEWEHPVKPKPGSKAAGISDVIYFRFKQ